MGCSAGPKSFPLKLGEEGDELGAVYLLGPDGDQTAVYKEKTVHLNRLKIGKRDGKGSKARV